MRFGKCSFGFRVKAASHLRMSQRLILCFWGARSHSIGGGGGSRRLGQRKHGEFVCSQVQLLIRCRLASGFSSDDLSTLWSRTLGRARFLLRHVYECHGPYAEYRKQVLFLAGQQGPRCLAAAEKRSIVQSYAQKQRPLPRVGATTGLRKVFTKPRRERRLRALFARVLTGWSIVFLFVFFRDADDAGAP